MIPLPRGFALAGWPDAHKVFGESILRAARKKINEKS
jgi:hypothetical protein